MKAIFCYLGRKVRFKLPFLNDRNFSFLKQSLPATANVSEV